jgi:YidC/Oxa1 family membrane protein insertase
MEKKEMSMETRLLIFFVLMGLILLGTQYFYKPPPPNPAAPSATNTAKPAANQPDKIPTPHQATAPAQNGAPTPGDLPGRVDAAAEETRTIETNLFKVTFSNRGAVVKSWILKAYKDHEGKAVDLVNPRLFEKVPAPFSVWLKNPLPTDPSTALFKMDSGDPLTVNFEFSDGRVLIKKSFKFTENSYLVGVSSEVTQNGVLVPHGLAWRGGFGDQTLSDAAAKQHAVYYDVGASKLQEKDAKEAKNGPVSTSGTYNFEGVEDNYFAAVFLPSRNAPTEVTVLSDTVANMAGTDEQRVGAAIGGDGINIGSLFVGPKDRDLLEKVDPKLAGLIDWGWFKVLAEPLYFALQWTYDHVVRNYGWAIVLLTLAINVVLSPLSLQSLKSSRKMQKIQPQITALNAKYKGLKMNDPRKQEQNQEMMDLYKREGVNPMGGCLPMLIQFPFLLAFYKMLNVSIALRGASWLWVHDLSQPETIAIRMLPVVLIVTQFLTQKMTPTPGVDPSQQKMMMITPLVFGYIFWFLSSGLVLYYLTSNVAQIARQMILNRISGPVQPASGIIDVKPTPSKKRRS